MMAKPMKSLELHYPMIQFLIKGFIAKNIEGELTEANDLSHSL